MASWSVLKKAIANIIKTNGNQKITGQLLQNTLNNIISSVGENATFVGIAVPTTNPGMPDGPVFYFAFTSGQYSNFSGFCINKIDNVKIFKWDGTKWNAIDTGLPNNSKVTELVKEISDKLLSEVNKKVQELSDKVDNQKEEVDAARDEAIKAINKEEQDAIHNFNSQRVTPEMLSKSTLDLINASGGGIINNMADDEDLYSTGGDTNVLKFANRIYNELNFSGKGYKILRKNVIDNKNILTQEMINISNYIYEIRYDFDLHGQTITIPEYSILKFNGGSISNGQIICSSNVVIKGFTFKNIISITLLDNCKFINNTLDGALYINGSNIIIDSCIFKDYDVDKSNSYSQIESNKNMRGVWKNNLKISNCTFYNFIAKSNRVYFNSILIHEITNTIISDNKFIGIGNNDIRDIDIVHFLVDNKTSLGENIFPYDDSSAFSSVYSKIDNNLFEKIGSVRGCIKIQASDVVVSNNVIKFDTENGNTNASALRVIKCDNVEVIGNTLYNTSKNIIKNISIELSKDIVFKNNSLLQNYDISLPILNTTTVINSVENVTVVNNIFNVVNTFNIITSTGGININISDNVFNILGDSSVLLSISKNYLDIESSCIVCNNLFNIEKVTGSYSSISLNSDIITAANNIVRVGNVKKFNFNIKSFKEANLIHNNFINCTAFYLIDTTEESSKLNIFREIIESLNMKNVKEVYIKGTTFTNKYSPIVLNNVPKTIVEDSKFIGVSTIANSASGANFISFYWCYLPTVNVEHSNNNDFSDEQVIISNESSALYGISSSRPSFVKNGTIFYDESIRKPIWKSNNRWLDSNGFTASLNRGTKPNRPKELLETDSGFLYYDTSIKKPIWWTGTKWVDAIGADA